MARGSVKWGVLRVRRSPDPPVPGPCLMREGHLAYVVGDAPTSAEVAIAATTR